MPDAPQPYGFPIGLETARKAAAPALAEARRNNWAMAVAIVDPAGELVYFERMEATQTGSIAVAIDKARSAARFKRPTKAFQDMLAGGGDGLRVFRIKGAVPVGSDLSGMPANEQSNTGLLTPPSHDPGGN